MNNNDEGQKSQPCHQHVKSRSACSDQAAVSKSRPMTDGFVTKNDVTVTLRIADIVKTKTDAVVTSEDIKLKHESMITKVLCSLEGGGRDFRFYRSKLQSSTTQRKYGDVFYTSMNRHRCFPFKYVLHAILHPLDKHHSDLTCWMKELHDLYSAIFKEADELRLKSIAIPFLGTGSVKADIVDATKAAVEAVAAHCPRYLESVQFVSLDHAPITYAREWCEKYLSEVKRVDDTSDRNGEVEQTSDDDSALLNDTCGSEHQATQHNKTDLVDEFKNLSLNMIETKYEAKVKVSVCGGNLQEAGAEQVSTQYGGADQFSSDIHVGDGDKVSKDSSSNADSQGGTDDKSDHDGHLLMDDECDQSDQDQHQRSCDLVQQLPEQIQEPGSQSQASHDECNRTGNGNPTENQKQTLEDLGQRQEKGWQNSNEQIEETTDDCEESSLQRQTSENMNQGTVDEDALKLGGEREEIGASHTDPKEHPEKTEPDDFNQELCESDNRTGVQKDNTGHLVETSDKCSEKDDAVGSPPMLDDQTEEPSSSSEKSLFQKPTPNAKKQEANACIQHGSSVIKLGENIKDSTDSLNSQNDERQGDPQLNGLKGTVCSKSVETEEDGQSASASTDETPETRDASKENDKKEDDICPICIDVMNDVKTLDKCGHKFCRECIDDSFRHFKPVCPSCQTVYGVLTGNMPHGTINVRTDRYPSLPGYEGVGVITIDYHFPNGIQTAQHPHPGKQYRGTSRTGFLPNNKEGRTVLALLRLAFERKLTFTVGRSATTGRDDVVIWNDIHHKTSTVGGPTGYGYPDETYLSRVKEELASKGVTEDQLPTTE